jgi:hypothetical protein
VRRGSLGATAASGGTLWRGVRGAAEEAPAESPLLRLAPESMPRRIATLELAQPKVADAGAEHIGAIEERLDRLERLLEQLVEQKQRSSEPRERH